MSKPTISLRSPRNGGKDRDGCIHGSWMESHSGDFNFLLDASGADIARESHQ